MTDALPIADLALKLIYAAVGLMVVVFGAGKAWASFSKVAGSQAAVHRRLTEIDDRSEQRYASLLSAVTDLRIEIAKVQTWKQTMRFKAPEGEAPLFKDNE